MVISRVLQRRSESYDEHATYGEGDEHENADTVWYLVYEVWCTQLNEDGWDDVGE